MIAARPSTGAAAEVSLLSLRKGHESPSSHGSFPSQCYIFPALTFIIPSPLLKTPLLLRSFLLPLQKLRLLIKATSEKKEKKKKKKEKKRHQGGSFNVDSTRFKEKLTLACLDASIDCLQQKLTSSQRIIFFKQYATRFTQRTVNLKDFYTIQLPIFYTIRRN